MNIDKLKSYYLNFIDQQTAGFDNAIQTSIRRYSKDFLSYLIDYSVNYTSTLDELEYSQIYEIVNAKDNNSKDIDFMLYLFSLKPYDAIKWVHYFESDDFFEPKREYISTSELAEIIESKDYYNPLSGNNISKEAFYNDLCTVFGLSDRFKKQIHQLKLEAD